MQISVKGKKRRREVRKGRERGKEKEGRRKEGRKEKKSEQVMGFMEAAYSSAGIDKPQEAQGPWVNSPKACSDSLPYLDAEVSTHQKIETFSHLSQLSPCGDAFQVLQAFCARQEFVM